MIKSRSELLIEIGSIISSGNVPLFHGTSSKFDRFEMIPERNRSYGNCAIGVHVTSCPFVALDYADKGTDDDAIILLSVRPGNFGLINDRDTYIHMTPENVRDLLSENADMDGFVADELGDDLTGSGIIIDPRSITICGKVSKSVISGMMDDPDDDTEKTLFNMLRWPGVSFSALDFSLDQRPEENFFENSPLP